MPENATLLYGSNAHFVERLDDRDVRQPARATRPQSEGE